MPRATHRSATEQDLKRLQEAALRQAGVRELLEAHRRHDQVLQELSFVTREDRIIISTYSDSTS